MADFSMFGPAASGARLVERDDAELEGLAARTGLARAQTKHFESLAAGHQMDLENQKRIREAMAAFGAAGSNPEAQAAAGAKTTELLGKAHGIGSTVAQPYYKAAEVYMKLGMPEKAASLAENATQMEQRLSAAQAAAQSEAKSKTDERLKLVNYANDLLSDITGDGSEADRQKYEQARMAFVYQFGDHEGLTNIPYELAPRLKTTLLSEYQKSRLSQINSDNASKAAARESANRFREFRKGHLLRAEQLALQAEERKAKNAGTTGRGATEKPVGAPTRGEVEAAEILAKKEFDIPAKEAALLGADIAARAKAIVRENKGMDLGTARAQALEEQRANVQSVEQGWNLFKRNKQRYLGPSGSTADLALPTPTNPEELKNLIPGRWYQTPNGPKKYTGPPNPRRSSGVVVDEGDDE